jgi:hypothetical protein
MGMLLYLVSTTTDIDLDRLLASNVCSTLLQFRLGTFR